MRELRNNGGRVLERVAAGERVVVTRDGHPVAELRPLPRRGLSGAQVLGRWRGLPALDASTLRADLDEVLDSRL